MNSRICTSLITGKSNIFAVMGMDAYEFMAYQMQEQRTDVYAALDYYFEHYNQGRPFILASHYQGSMMLKIALRDYFREHADYLERMVAAYVIHSVTIIKKIMRRSILTIYDEQIRRLL